MAEMLSPGVYVTEIDASTIVPTVSNSVAAFAGNFHQGRVGKYTLITSVDDLISFYGKPSNVNYNDWYQAYNFLAYGNKLLISRAANVGGTSTAISGIVLNADIVAGETDTVTVDSTVGVEVDDLITFGTSMEWYKVIAVTADTSIQVERVIEDDLVTGDPVNSYMAHTNGVFEAVSQSAVAEAVTNDYEYISKMMSIGNEDDYESLETSIAFTNNSDSKLKFIARSPGEWSKDLEICIANPDSFGNGTQAFDGISLDDLFEYAPTGTEVGIIVKLNDEIKEVFTVDFDQTARDVNNKSTYVETVINNQSNLIFVKDNTSVSDVKDYTFTAGTTVKLVNGMDSAIQADDIIDAFDVFANKEELEIDIVIGNELDSGASAKELCDTRKDCIGFIGANYGDVVGKKSADAVSNLIDWRKNGDLNYNNMFVVACGNYKYQYDKVFVA